MFIPFNKISENYKCWVYQIGKMITQKEKVFISKSLESFCEKWTSHNNSVKSSYVIDFDSFIILFADQRINKVSGCAIDEKSRVIRQIGNNLKIKILPYINTGVFINNKLVFLSKEEIISKLNSKEINGNSDIINITIKSKKDYEEKWILKIKESWLKNFLAQKQHI
tara:strand:- start:704 stop:1204 length:501 start_codon:yes stop_codon:yes gene_type:complete